jgi:hypothetical protein
VHPTKRQDVCPQNWDGLLERETRGEEGRTVRSGLPGSQIASGHAAAAVALAWLPGAADSAPKFQANNVEYRSGIWYT